MGTLHPIEAKKQALHTFEHRVVLRFVGKNEASVSIII